MENEPNNFDETIANAQNANSQEEKSNVTETDTTDTNGTQEAEPDVDYRKKFAESAKEAQRLYEENKRLRELNEAKGTQEHQTEETQEDETMENLYPGFEYLDEDARNNLLAYTEGVTRKAKEELYKDPAIAFARKAYNESTWDRAFDQVQSKYPELASSKEDFKKKYYNVNNVPQNIDSILEDIAKIYLFDKARDIGASDERTRADRIEMQRTTGGDKTQSTGRTLDDWQRLAQENPAKFAQMSKEYNADVATGKLKE